MFLPFLKVSSQIPLNFNVPDVMIESSALSPLTFDANTRYLSLGENSVYINPIHPNNLLMGSNANYDDPIVINDEERGVAIFLSEDGGITWKPTVNGPKFITIPSGNADPSSAIDHLNRQYFNSINGINSKNEIIYSDDNFITRNGPLALSFSTADKNHLEIDDRPIADHIKLFAGWINTAKTDIYIRKADVFNQTIIWNSNSDDLTDPSTYILPSNSNFKYHQGINISVAPNGDAYATWGIYYGTGTANTSEKYIGFASWNHITQTWTSYYIPNLVINGIRNNSNITSSLPTCKAGDLASWMTSAVNQQNGDIYIVWPNVGIPCNLSTSNCNCMNSTCNTDIYFIKSSDGGINWSNPQIVNTSNGDPHWDSWLACDPYTGYLGVIYYSKTGTGSTAQTNAFLSLSVDGGNTWTEQQISDTYIGSTSNIPLFKTDYISLKMNNGLVVPVWTGIDNIPSNYSRQTAICQSFEMDVPISISLCNPVTPYYEIVKAQNTILLSDLGCGYEIPSGSYINMYASNNIKMSEGFHATAGSKFHAHIESFIDPFHANERRGNEKIFEEFKNDNSIKLTSYPNPFHDFANISITSLFSTKITLCLYDNYGKFVKKILSNTSIEKGTSLYQISSDQFQLSSGVYYCVLTSLFENKTIKLICIN